MKNNEDELNEVITEGKFKGFTIGEQRYYDWKIWESQLKFIITQEMEKIAKDPLAFDVDVRLRTKIANRDILEAVAKELDTPFNTLLQMILFEYFVNSYKSSKRMEQFIKNNPDKVRNDIELEKINLAIKLKERNIKTRVNKEKEIE